MIEITLLLNNKIIIELKSFGHAKNTVCTSVTTLLKYWLRYLSNLDLNFKIKASQRGHLEAILLDYKQEFKNNLVFFSGFLIESLNDLYKTNKNEINLKIKGE